MENQRTVTASDFGDVCDICHGTGIQYYEKEIEGYNAPLSFARKCPKCSKHAFDDDETGIPQGCRSMDLYRFNFKVYRQDMQKFEKIIWSFFNNYEKWKAAGKGIYLWSETPGSGKTFLSCCLVQSINIKYGCRFRFITAPDYLSMVRDSYKRQDGERDRTKIYRECELLVFDDIGAQKSGDWQQSEIFRLVNARMENGLVTIYTSNVSTEKLKLDQRTINRIQKTAIELQMPEESIRKKKTEEERDKFLNEILA